MSLYDDDDTVTDKTASSGWSSGIKMMQSQLAFKKATITAPKRDSIRKRADKLAPVIDLKSRRDEEENTPPYLHNIKQENTRTPQRDTSDTEWKFFNEYDPFWPNDYEKVVKETRERRDREDDDKRRQERDDRDKKRRENYRDETGFSRNREQEEEEEEERDRTPRRAGGAAIAPPPSLDCDGPINLPMPTGAQRPSFGAMGGSSIAAKIMAKYGFKEGQGLGKSQQGIVKALEVEKTSKRGGRIVTENEGSASPPPPSYSGIPGIPAPPLFLSTVKPTQDKQQETNISTILRNPSKVIMLLNMVASGEVDDDLVPEVRDECTAKYGPVTQVVIFEIPKAIAEEAVRIFVEFQRVESAVKAIIDLNGRFFAGRQVKAGFYDIQNFKDLKLNETIIF